MLAATCEAAADADFAGSEVIPSEENAAACPLSTTTVPAGAEGAISEAGVAALDFPSAGTSFTAEAIYERALYAATAPSEH